jgi:phosphatidylethanolamine-binding protein (PEBP) family uncharacterized protein
MSSATYEIEAHRQQTGLEQWIGSGQSQLQNCSLGLGGYNCLPQTQYWYTAPPPSLHDYEIVISQLTATADPILNYGAKLRLLIADPIKGHDLREAIHKLKIALKEAYA